MIQSISTSWIARYFRRMKVQVLLTTLLACALCTSPWTGQFGFEFSFFFSIGCFFVIWISGSIQTISATSFVDSVRYVGCNLLLLVPPLLVVWAAAMVYGFCSFGMGLQWFVLLPGITTIFASASILLATRISRDRGRIFLIALLPTLILSAVTMIDLLYGPKVSFFHPVLGYFPGPIYDEWIPLFPSVYSYRLWVLVFSFSMILQPAKFVGRTRAGILLAPVGLLLIYFVIRQPLGWHYSHPKIQNELGRRMDTSYSQIFFDPRSLPNPEAFAQKVDEHIKSISLLLQIPVDRKNKVRIYVYPTPLLKKKWTGTYHTLVGNPIQKTLHILALTADDPILVHELTHVVAAPMGVPMLGISTRIGLLEGLATALQKQQRSIDIDQWSKTMMDINLLPKIETVFGVFSFWKESPTRAYLASGSFVRWLIQTYGIEPFKKVYRGSRPEHVYQQPVEKLVSDWKNHLSRVVVDPEIQKSLEKYLLAKPFHLKRCVHEIADWSEQLRTCQEPHCTFLIRKICDKDATRSACSSPQMGNPHGGH